MTTRNVTACPAHSEYTIQAYDNLTKIALNEYGISKDDQGQINSVIKSITKTNHILNPNDIQVGQVLVLTNVEMSDFEHSENKAAAIVDVYHAQVKPNNIFDVGYFIDETSNLGAVQTPVNAQGPFDWHLDRNEGMLCPSQMPEHGTEWYVNHITVNPFSFLTHGYGNYDVRGLHDKAGTQCIYSPDGKLITDERAGTKDYSPPINPETGNYEFVRILNHAWDDVIPEMLIASRQPEMFESK